MTKIALRYWILLCALLPSVLASVGLGSYFAYSKAAELNRNLAAQARNIAVPLAISSEKFLAADNIDAIQQLLNTSHRLNSPVISNILLYDQHANIIASSNPQYSAADYPPINRETASPAGQLLPFEQSLLSYQPLSFNSHPPAQSPYIVLHLQNEQIELQQQRYKLHVAMLVAAVILLCLLLSQLVRKKIHPVLSGLQLQLQQLQAGNYQQQKTMSGIAELDEFQTSINQLSEQLTSLEQEMQQNIEQVTSDLQLSMEQLEVQNIQLDFSRRKAVEENRQKSEFLAKMSHELRTPLNGVIGFTRQLLKTQLSANQHDYLSTIQKSANSLLHLVNDVLDFSKLEEGRMSINPEPFSLRDLLNDATELLAANAFDKHLELVMMIDNGCPDDLIADPGRLIQVLMNIAGNAIKFTEHGSIVIRVSATLLNEDQLILHCSVQDTGRGISEDKQDQLFQGFTSSQPGDHNSGSGLGLMISQRLVQAMGGNIGFESKAAEGSTFWFTIKCQRHHLSVAEPLPIDVLDGKSLLYFEPQQYSREATLSLLHSWGLQVTACATKGQLQQALNHGQHYDIGLIGRAIAINQVNLIISLVQQIKPSCQYTYLLVNTLSPNLREAMLTSGVDGCLPKPTHQRKLAIALAKPYLDQAKNLPVPVVQPRAALKVLTVDDNEANLKLINALLSELVEQIESATNGADAWQKATQHVYDIIFMDINMPVMDGISACQRIRQSSLNEHTPIIAVTAHAVAGERARLLSLGFSEFLSKPLDDKMLHYTLQEFCPLIAQAHQNTETQQAAAYLKSDNNSLIDWQMGLQRAGGKVDLAKEMLKMLLTSLPQTQQALNAAISAHDCEQVLQLVHKLHGACCYTGVPALKNLAETLETQLKSGTSLSQLEPELFELDDIVNALTQLDENWLATVTLPE
ncbi:two-component sensor histidine kinase BarA [Arsukibacterium sp.]|uniref:two-component sensor histidine kinase BarA n=1 Tax=Arsukibacterium sp. TaxID=1977258 RepID=UPI00299CDA74|nr:two-component sensor histidine kinase BarA [Arsukibacterium sp.]MDX1677477.1 two-component sensor histidine kinase BarA [Arsukibacterium sp.]